jgi:hypothetical protein
MNRCFEQNWSLTFRSLCSILPHEKKTYSSESYLSIILRRK